MMTCLNPDECPVDYTIRPDGACIVANPCLPDMCNPCDYCKWYQWRELWYYKPGWVPVEDRGVRAMTRFIQENGHTMEVYIKNYGRCDG